MWGGTRSILIIQKRLNVEIWFFFVVFCSHIMYYFNYTEWLINESLSLTIVNIVFKDRPKVRMDFIIIIRLNKPKPRRFGRVSIFARCA